MAHSLAEWAFLFTDMMVTLKKFNIIALIVLAIITMETPGHTAEEIHFVREFQTGLVAPVDIAVANDGPIYVLDEEKARVSVYSLSGEFQIHFDKPQEESARLKAPRSLALSPRGRIIVADTGNDRVMSFDQAGKLVFQFGSRGFLPGQFRSPSGVAVDQFGFIFVADRENRRVQIFTPNGIFFKSFDTPARPSDITVDSQRNLYVLIPELSRIVKYRHDGQRLQEMSCVMNKKDFLASAQGLAVDCRGDLYLIEHKFHSVQKMDRKERILISFGSEGKTRGQFQRAGGLYVDRNDQLFIADTGNNRIQVFKITGSEQKDLASATASSLVLDFDSTLSAQRGIVDLFFLPGKGLYMLADTADHVLVRGRTADAFQEEGPLAARLSRPQSLTLTLDGKIFVADTEADRIQILKEDGGRDYFFGTTGNQAGQFRAPRGLAVNSKGKIFVADTLNNRIQVFNYDGIFLSSFTGNSRRQGNPESQTTQPAAVAIDGRDRVYVLNPLQHRVQIYGEQGQYLGSIGRRGSGPGQFDRPVDISIDENNIIYVADQGNNRIQLFDPQGRFLLAFGSPGTGGGYFQELTSVAAAEGKVYVADKAAEDVQVFRYTPEGIDNKERFHATRTAAPAEVSQGNPVVRYHEALKAAKDQALENLAEVTGRTKGELLRSVKVEGVASLKNGQVKVTLSVPKDLKVPDKVVTEEKKEAEGKP